MFKKAGVNKKNNNWEIRKIWSQKGRFLRKKKRSPRKYFRRNASCNELL